MCRVDPDREQRWWAYAMSLLAFSVASVVVLYAQLRLQGNLPLNPDNLANVRPDLSFNTAVSFLCARAPASCCPSRSSARCSW